MHLEIIIVGAGSIGFTIARTLSKRHSVVVIEDDEDRVNFIAENLDVATVNGNGANPKILRSVINGNTKLMIAVTAKDEINMFACMVAKQIKKEIVTVARVRNLDYIQGDMGNLSSFMDHTISPELLLVRKMLRIADICNLIDFEPVPRYGVSIAKFRVEEGHRPATMVPLAKLPMPNECTVLAIHRGDRIIMPKMEDVLIVGDEVTVLATHEGLVDFDRMLGCTQKAKDFIIIGGGLVGELLASGLEERKARVKLIEKDEKRCRYLSKRLPNTVVIHGNGSDPTLLRSENVNMSNIMMCVSESEECNLLSALFGKHLGVGKVMALFSKRDYENVFDRREIDVPLGYYHVMANEILDLVSPEFKVFLSVEDFSEEFFSVQVDGQKKIDGKALNEIDFPDRSTVALVVRGTIIHFPTPGLRLQKGDVVLIYASNADVPILARLFDTDIPIGP